VIANVGSVYNEYDDYYEDCNDAPVRLIASFTEDSPYSLMGEAMTQCRNIHGDGIEAY
jgi:hypothetical protein